MSNNGEFPKNSDQQKNGIVFDPKTWQYKVPGKKEPVAVSDMTIEELQQSVCSLLYVIESVSRIVDSPEDHIAMMNPQGEEDLQNTVLNNSRDVI